MKSILGFVIGIIASILANIYTSYRNKKRISYYQKSKVIIDKQQNLLGNIELLVYLKEKEIENLTISIFSLWNSGTSTIHTSDIKEKIQIETKNQNVEILDCLIEMQTVDATESRISLMNNRNINVQFDHLDRFEGMIIKVLYSSTKLDELNLKGSLKERGKLFNIHNTFAFKFYRIFKFLLEDETSPQIHKYKNYKYLEYFYIISIIISIFSIYFYSDIKDDILDDIIKAVIEVLQIISFFYVFIFSFVIIPVRLLKLYLKYFNPFPSDIEKFYDDNSLLIYEN